MTEKITYLDGLRGIAAINVMIMHFFIALAPAMIYGDQLPSHLGNLEHVFSSTPLGLIGAGNFSVCIFFVLSGYVLTQKFFKIRDKSIIISSVVRRYVRLFIPVLASIVLSFLLLSTGLFHYYIEAVMISAGSSSTNYWTNYWTFSPSIIDALKQAMWGSFFVGGEISYNPVLWTMKIEFYGSMLVFAIAFLFGSQRSRWTIYFAAAMFFFNTYYLAFIIGMVFADTFNSRMSPFKTSNNMILSIILILGLFLGSYPVYNVTHDSLYGFLNNGFFQTPKITYHISGAGMIMYVLMNSRLLQNIFSYPVSVFLGKISYSLYLVHFLVISSFTSALFLFLYPVLPYSAAALTSCFCSLVLIIPLSYLFYRYVDTAGVEFSKIFYNQLVKFCLPEGAGKIKQGHLSSTVLTIYNKFFK
jgi:peptidoglycan/LPS O-acetylase OafA/YrhL